LNHLIGWLFGGSGAVVVSAVGAWLGIQYNRVKHRILAPLKQKNHGPSSEQAYLDPHFIEVLDNAPYRAEPANEDDLSWITTKTAQLYRSNATPLENKRA
jgi:hypothetical protein